MSKHPQQVGLFAVIAVIVFGFVPGYQSSDGHNFTAYYLIIAFCVGLLAVHWTVKLFAGVCAASCVWLQYMVANVQPRELMPRFFQLYTSANCDLQYVLIFVGLYAAIVWRNPSMDTWLNFLCLIALVEILRISGQALGWDPVLVPMNRSRAITDVGGSQGNIGWTGMVLAMCTPGFLRPRVAWGLIPLLGALYVERSLTPMIAVAGAIGLYALVVFRGRERLLCVLAAIFGLYLYQLYDPGDSARFANWARAWDLCKIRQAWFLGFGLGSWIFIFPEPGTSFHRAHCEPLQVWFELGFCGVAALLLYFRFIFVRFLEAGRSGAGLHASAGIVAVILCSLGNFPFHLGGCAIIAVPWMAMFECATRERSEQWQLAHTH